MTGSSRTLALCLLGALCEGYDVQAAGVTAAGLGAELHPSSTALGLYFAASGAGLLVGALLGGRLADRVGRKRVLVLSLVVFGVFAGLTALAGDLHELTAARFVTGLGLGGAMPTLIVLAASVTEPRARHLGIALTYLGMPVGAGLAGVVSLTTSTGAWRTVFLVGAAAPLLIAPAIARWLPDPGRSAHARPASTLAILFGERRAVRTLLLWLAFLLVVLTLHLLINWLPMLMLGRGLAKDQAVLAQIGFNVGGAATALGFGRMLDSPWRRTAIAGAVIVVPATLALLASTSAPPLLFVLAILLGGGVLAQQVIAFAAASASYPAIAGGTGVGAAVAAGRIGSLVGPLFASTLLAAGRTPAEVLLGLLPIALACGACIVTLSGGSRPGRPSRDP